MAGGWWGSSRHQHPAQRLKHGPVRWHDKTGRNSLQAAAVVLMSTRPFTPDHLLPDQEQCPAYKTQNRPAPCLPESETQSPKTTT